MNESIQTLLAHHFGERLEEPCGHCCGCRDEHLPLPETVNRAIPETLSAALGPLLDEKGDLFDSPRVFNRFLCGIASPKLSRAKLSGHRLFASLVEVPFAQVMAWAENRLVPSALPAGQQSSIQAS